MGPHLYQGACLQSCTLAACGWQLGEAPGGRLGVTSDLVLSLIWDAGGGPRGVGEPQRGRGTPKGQPLTTQGPLQDEVLRGLRVRVTLLSLPRVGGLKRARRDAPASCPTPALPAGHGLGALIGFAARAPSQAPAPGAVGCREKWGWGEVKEGAPAPSGCAPSPLHAPHSPDELRLWLLAGLVLPEATPRRWLHPREMVVRGTGE